MSRSFQTVPCTGWRVDQMKAGASQSFVAACPGHQPTSFPNRLTSGLAFMSTAAAPILSTAAQFSFPISKTSSYTARNQTAHQSPLLLRRRNRLRCGMPTGGLHPTGKRLFLFAKGTKKAAKQSMRSWHFQRTGPLRQESFSRVTTFIPFRESVPMAGNSHGRAGAILKCPGTAQSCGSVI